MKYFYILFDSFTKPAFYVSLLETPIKKIVGFFIFSIILFGGIQGALLSTQMLPLFISEIRLLHQELTSKLPEDFTLQLSNSTLTISPEPLIIAFPANSQFAKQTYKTNLLTYFESTLPISSLSAQLSASSLSILTPSMLYISQGPDSWSSFSLDSLGMEQEISATKTSFLEFTGTIIDSIENNTLLIHILIWIGSITMLLLSALWTTVLQTTFAYFLISLRQTPLSWFVIFKLSLHVIVVLTVVDTMLFAIFGSTGANGIAILYWLYALLIYREMTKKGVLKKKKL